MVQRAFEVLFVATILLPPLTVAIGALLVLIPRPRRTEMQQPRHAPVGA
jgi:membrane protein CcdC involved in cytochrome C biogenesis